MEALKPKAPAYVLDGRKVVANRLRSHMHHALRDILYVSLAISDRSHAHVLFDCGYASLLLLQDRLNRRMMLTSSPSKVAGCGIVCCAFSGHEYTSSREDEHHPVEKNATPASYYGSPPTGEYIECVTGLPNLSASALESHHADNEVPSRNLFAKN